jgi:hypothetical protein
MTRRLFLALMVLVQASSRLKRASHPMMTLTPLPGNYIAQSAPTRLWTYVKPRLARTGGPR